MSSHVIQYCSNTQITPQQKHNNLCHDDPLPSLSHHSFPKFPFVDIQQPAGEFQVKYLTKYGYDYIWSITHLPASNRFDCKQSRGIPNDVLDQIWKAARSHHLETVIILNDWVLIAAYGLGWWTNWLNLAIKLIRLMNCEWFGFQSTVSHVGDHFVIT